MTPAAATLTNQILLPNGARVPRYNQQKSSSAIPLIAPGYTHDLSQAHRRPGPTTVRVILDRIENLRSDFIFPGHVTRLGEAERVRLKAGDRLEVTVWSGNKCPFQIDTGVLCDQPLKDFLSGMQIVKSPGGTFGTSHLAEINKLSAFSRRFLARGGGVYGGVGGGVLVGTATKDIEVSFSAVARPAGQAGNLIDVPSASVNDVLHQQFQSYGGFEGNFRFSQNKSVFQVAAPGSFAYHGVGFNPADVDQKRAAYWVPIRMKLSFDGAVAPKAVSVIGHSGGAWMSVDANGFSVQLTKTEPTAIFGFQKDMDLTLTFLGSAVTLATIQAKF